MSEQRERARRESKLLERKMASRGRKLSPVRLEGRTIARSFWGKAWCENLESYRDYAYRLPRGRSYVRNGAVLDLRIGAGVIQAVVSGTSLYEVDIRIEPLAKAHWRRIKARCAGQIGSLIELLEGRLSERVMALVTGRGQGLFPEVKEIKMACTCPDRATMCKHVAAVMYAVGAQLDAQPELLFTLRNVDHGELIAAELRVPKRSNRRRTIEAANLADVFGIELAEMPERPVSARKRSGGRSASTLPRSAPEGRAGTTPERAARNGRKRRTSGH